MAGDPLKGINVEAAGGASKVLKMIAEQVRVGFELPLRMAQSSVTRHVRSERNLLVDHLAGSKLPKRRKKVSSRSAKWSG